MHARLMILMLVLAVSPAYAQLIRVNSTPADGILRNTRFTKVIRFGIFATLLFVTRQKNMCLGVESSCDESSLDLSG